LDGKVALVSGASRGIGRRICEVLRDQGASVAAIDLSAPAIDGILGISADVTDPAAVDAAVSIVEEQLGVVQVVVLNAGILRFEPFAETTLDTWRRTIDVNLTGAYICAHRVVPKMATTGWGRVVSIGSSAGKTGGGTPAGAYAASKAGVMTLAKSLASEYARAGVTSNALAPALIDTEMASAMPDMHDRVPVGRLGTTDDVAALVAFLCSSHASFITGEVVDINGGFFID